MANAKGNAQRRRDLRQWMDDKDGGHWHAVTIPSSQHGTWNTYNNWYCRCKRCRSANKLRQKYKAIQKEEDNGE